MKKVLLALLLVILPVFLLTGNKVKAATSDTFNYTADFTKGLPSDWLIYDKSASSQTTVTNGSGNVSIKHAGTVNAAKYHGALYRINPSKLSSVGDFTFEMKFSVKTYENVDRWLGIMYHTNLDSSNNLTGYMMNYRVSGKSAQSTISISNGQAVFTDSLEIEKAGNVLSDNSTHTIKLVCSGSQVTHYMDGKEIVSYDYKNYSTGLDKIHSTGGFALIVNRMTLNISSMKITGQFKEEKELDTTITSTYNPDINFAGEIAAMMKIDSKADLSKLIVDDVKPSTAILYVDENMNVTSESGTSLGMSIKDAYLDYLYQRIIPTFYIKNQTVADKFIDYYQENIALMDAFVASDDPKIVKAVREELYYLRGIIDYSNQNVDETDWKKIVAESNSSYANVVILNPEDASYEAIRYIQARFKSVWIDNEKMDKLDVKEQLVNGAYGIIYNDFRFVYNTIQTYSNQNLMMNRMPYNIAHRGMCFTVAENSLEGFVQSYNNGATHIEIDIRLTKDNQIVLMHDETIDRTTNGTGKVAEMTLAEIQKYKIDSYLNETITDTNKYAKIPSLDEVFKEFKDKDVVLVVEIKSYEVELINQLKKLIEKYDMADNMVIISFHNSQLVNVKNIIPQIPSALLINTNEDVFTTTLMTIASMNCGFDGGTWAVTDTHLRKLAVRGYSSWMWTYQREENIVNGIKSGVLGITNNEPNEIADYATRIEFASDTIISANDSYNNQKATLVKYDAKQNETKSVIIAEKQEFDGYAEVIYKFTYTNGDLSYVVFSDKVTVIKKSLNDKIINANSILDKDVEDLTEDDVKFLEEMILISEELEGKNINKLSSNSIEQKLAEYQEYIKSEEENQPNPNPNPDDNNQESGDVEVDQEEPKNDEGGCFGSVVGTSVACLTLLGGVLVLRRKRDDE